MRGGASFTTVTLMLTTQARLGNPKLVMLFTGKTLEATDRGMRRAGMPDYRLPLEPRLDSISGLGGNLGCWMLSGRAHREEDHQKPIAEVLLTSPEVGGFV